MAPPGTLQDNFSELGEKVHSVVMQLESFISARKEDGDWVYELKEGAENIPQVGGAWAGVGGGRDRVKRLPAACSLHKEARICATSC